MLQTNLELPDYRDTQQCVDAAQSAIKERSDLAEEYTIKYLDELYPGKAKMGDVNIDNALVENGFKPIGTNKTPDIFLLVENTLWLGDVTVTSDPADREVRKRDKYDNVMRMIDELNPVLKVHFITFAFHEGGDNMQAIVDKLNSLSNSMMGIVVGRRENELVNSFRDIKYYIEDITKNVVQKENFIKMMMEFSDEDDEDVGSGVVIPTYMPSVTEEDIVLSIFSEAQKAPQSKKSEDVDLKQVKRKLDEMNDSMKPRKPKQAIPFLFNTRCESIRRDLALLKDYADDLADSHKETSDSILTLLPCCLQMERMKEMKDLFNEQRSNPETKNTDRVLFMQNMQDKFGQKSPYFCPTRELSKGTGNSTVQEWFVHRINRQNVMKEPSSIHSSEEPYCIDDVEAWIDALGSETNFESTNLKFDIPTDYKRPDRSRREEANVKMLEKDFEIVNKSLGAVLCTNVRKLVQDVIRIPKGIKKGIYYSIPVSGNSITLVFTDANFSNNNTSIYFASVTRFLKCDISNDSKTEKLYRKMRTQAKFVEETTSYIYLLSKLQRYDLDKLSKLANVDYEMRSHFMSMSVMSDLNEADGTKIKYMRKYIGTTAMLVLDLHQKPSDILDLMKYLVSMPMSSHNNLDVLLLDKLNIMRKTTLDVWLVSRVFDFLNMNMSLRKTRKCNQIMRSKDGIVSESFGITGQFAMFMDPCITTESIEFYLSEAQLLFHARPKKLYNSQFIDKSAIKVVKNNRKMLEEEMQHPGWTTEGLDKNTDPNSFYTEFNFPYQCEFAFSRDALHYAQLDEDSRLSMHIKNIKRRSAKGTRELFIYNLSMRGSCIIPGSMLEMRSMNKQYSLATRMKTLNPRKVVKLRRSATAMQCGIVEMMDDILNDRTDKCRVGSIMITNKHRTMFYNMSEKEQRGGGRPIGSADFYTKQKLYCLEKHYQNIGKQQPENMLAKGIHRGSKLSNMVRHIIDRATKNNMRFISNIVMDQSQFSESDNIRKFVCNIKDNKCIPEGIKGDLVDAISTMESRVQFFPRMPELIKEEYPEYINGQDSVKGVAGWVQGMLNISSTHIHIIAVRWLVRMFNKYYAKVKGIDEQKSGHIIVEQSVNSDDSFAIIAAYSQDVLEDFYDFFVLGKRLFCLKQNIKKSYMSPLIGEVIQKYIVNGSTVNIWAKDAVAVYNNTQGLDLSKDISAAVGALQNLMRNGAPECLVTYIRAELKSQIFRKYNLGNGQMNDLSKIKIDITKMPIQLGGWPGNVTTFELCMSGTQAQLEYCRVLYKEEECNEKAVCIASICLNMVKKTSIQDINTEVFLDEDQQAKVNSILTFRHAAERMMRFASEEEYDEGINTEIEDIANEMRVADVDSEIAFEAIGFDTMTGNFTQSLLNPFAYALPFKIKVTDTVLLLKSFQSQGSGLAGLIRLRTSISQAVADVRDNASSLLLSLSEMGFTQDIRQKASASSSIASKKCVTIKGFKEKMTILGAYRFLLRAYFRFKNRQNMKDASEKLEFTLTDPTHRAQYASHVVRNTDIHGTKSKGPIVVNQMPRTMVDMELANDLQMVLCEILSPGILDREGYRLRSTNQFQNDIDIVHQNYGDWLMNTQDKLAVAQSIYFYYLSERRSRWMVGPPLDNKDMVSFMISVFLSCMSPHERYVGKYMGSRKIDTTKTERVQVMNDTIMSFYEIAVKLNIRRGLITSSEVVNNIIIETELGSGSIRALHESGVLATIYNEADDFQKMHMGVLVLHYLEDSSLLERCVKTKSFSINWIQEQKKQYNPKAGRSTWSGSFEVEVRRGENAIIIKGEPGNMEYIRTNTTDIRKITELLLHFRMKNRFDNYPVKKSSVGFYDDKFFSSRLYVPGTHSIIPKPRLSSTVEVDPVTSGRITVEEWSRLGCCRLLYSDDNEFTGTRSAEAGFEKFHIDFNKNKLYGVVKEATDVLDHASGVTTRKMIDRYIEVDSLSRYYNSFSTEFFKFNDIRMEGLDMESLKTMKCLSNMVREKYYDIDLETLGALVSETVDDISILSDTVKVLYNLVMDDVKLPVPKMSERLEMTTVELIEPIIHEVELDHLDGLDEYTMQSEIDIVNVGMSQKSIGGCVVEAYMNKMKKPNLKSTIDMFFSSGIIDTIQEVITNCEEDGIEDKDDVMGHAVDVLESACMAVMDQTRDDMFELDEFTYEILVEKILDFKENLKSLGLYAAMHLSKHEMDIIMSKIDVNRITPAVHNPRNTGNVFKMISNIMAGEHIINKSRRTAEDVVNDLFK